MNLTKKNTTICLVAGKTIQKGAEAFFGKGHIKPFNAEVMQLCKELVIVREERDI